MKIGICLTGVSHEDGIRVPHGYYRKVNFDCCPLNIIEKIINPLKRDNEVDVYLTTYNHEYILDLFDKYSPKKYQLIPYSNSTMQKTYAQSLQQLNGENLDFVISTRFDILFNKSINDICLDYNKMNVLFNEDGWDHLHYTCDNFFAFPFKFLNLFIQSIHEFEKIDRNGLHGTFNHFSNKIGKENTKIIDDIPGNGRKNSYYYLPCVIR